MSRPSIRPVSLSLSISVDMSARSTTVGWGGGVLDAALLREWPGARQVAAPARSKRKVARAAQ